MQRWTPNDHGLIKSRGEPTLKDLVKNNRRPVFCWKDLDWTLPPPTSSIWSPRWWSPAACQTAKQSCIEGVRFPQTEWRPGVCRWVSPVAECEKGSIWRRRSWLGRFTLFIKTAAAAASLTGERQHLLRIRNHLTPNDKQENKVSLEPSFPMVWIEPRRRADQSNDSEKNKTSASQVRKAA